MTAQALTASSYKTPAPVRPTLKSQVTAPQFRRFKSDWKVFLTLAHLPPEFITGNLYECCDDTLKTNVYNTIPDFLTLTETDFLDRLEALTTQHSNPIVHILKFAQLTQEPLESIQDYTIRLKMRAVDCEFVCPNANCKQDLTDIHVRNQLIIGLQDQRIQTDILAKATQLKSLADIVKHAEALEAATRDQSSITAANETINRVSDYRRNKNQKSWSTQKHDHQHKHPPCIGCGSTEHGSHERQRKCPEWNKTCQSCFKPNHNSSVCRSKRVSSEHESTNAVLIARIIQK